MPEGSLFDQFRTTNRHARESVLANARLAVQAQLNSGTRDPHAGGVDIVLETGTRHVGLLRQAERTSAGVMVVWPGAAATDVVRHAATVVLVARRSPRGPVVGVSDSDPSLPALRLAAIEARRRHAPLHLLHAFDIAPFAERRPPAAAVPYLQGKSWIALEGLDELQARAKRRLEEALLEAVYWARPLFSRVRLPKLLSDMPNRSLRSSWWLARRGAAASSF